MLTAAGYSDFIRTSDARNRRRGNLIRKCDRYGDCGDRDVLIVDVETRGERGQLIDSKRIYRCQVKPGLEECPAAKTGGLVELYERLNRSESNVNDGERIGIGADPETGS